VTSLFTKVYKYIKNTINRELELAAKYRKLIFEEQVKERRRARVKIASKEQPKNGPRK
jgi:hypothetical protein